MSRKRELVAELVAHGLSERGACQAVGLHRSTYRYQGQISLARQQQAEQLRTEVVRLAAQHRRFGYRRVTALLRRAGQQVNHKRIWRIWQQGRLSLPRRRPAKRRANAQQAPAALPTKASRCGEVWTYDFVFDRTERGQTLKMLVVLDEYSRECPAIAVDLRMDSSDVTRVLGRLFALHGAPIYLRSDNGGEFIATALGQWLTQQGTQTMHIAPGHPWENGYAESFIGKFRDECLNGEVFWSAAHAQVIVEQWRRWYNEGRPHSALGYQTPAEVAVAAGGCGQVDSSTTCPPVHNPDDGDGHANT